MSSKFSAKKVIKSCGAPLVILISMVLLLSFVYRQTAKPVLYIIGDSTVKNGQGTGGGSMWGWGSFLDQYFDTTRIQVNNQAIGGRSSRTFITEGRWDKVLEVLKPGDFVMMQFGHNDASPLDDTARARGTIRGIGEEWKEIYNPITHKQEIVHTYGWYMRKFVNEARAKGATAIVCSLVPRSNWSNGKVNRSGNDYGKWAEETASSSHAYFIDLNNMIADTYDAMGEEKVNRLFPSDHTHTNKEGAIINALAVVEGIKKIRDCPLYKYLKPTDAK